MTPADFLTTVVALIFAFSMAAGVLILGVIAASAIGGKVGTISRGRRHFVVDNEPALQPKRRAS